MEKLALKGKQFAGFCLLILFSIVFPYLKKRSVPA